METSAQNDWLSGDTARWSGRGIRNKKTGAVYIIGHVFQNGRVEIKGESGEFALDVPTVREHYEACAYRTKATVYNAKKVEIAQIDGVEILEPSPAGQMIRFKVPGKLEMGEYILLLEDQTRVGFTTWDTTPETTTEQSTFLVPMIPLK